VLDEMIVLRLAAIALKKEGKIKVYLILPSW
jgi:hypothetical protein